VKCIIAGSRSITECQVVAKAIIASRFIISEVVSGGAKGVDKLGEQLAKFMGKPMKRFPAEWNKHGRGAGYLRNTAMAKYADALIAVWDGKSKGTKHMIDAAREKHLKVFVVKVVRKGDL
jgi:hypothetical protein